MKWDVEEGLRMGGVGVFQDILGEVKADVHSYIVAEGFP